MTRETIKKNREEAKISYDKLVVDSSLGDADRSMLCHSITWTHPNHISESEKTRLELMSESDFDTMIREGRAAILVENGRKLNKA